MTDIRFYHMEQSTLDQALPAITLKAFQSGKRVIIKAPDAKEVKRLDNLLWTSNPNVFLPHGADGDKSAARQPVFVTDKDENANEAEILILTHGCTHETVADFFMCCEMLDGRVDTQITAARARWKTYKDADHDLTYWQQDANGGWGRK